MAPIPSPLRWYHLVWTTHGRRPCFKIAAAASLCERAVRSSAARLGWLVDSILVREHQIHALFATPPEVPQESVAQLLLDPVTQTFRDAKLAPERLPLFAERGWCVPLASAVRVTAVRRQLRRWREQSRTQSYRTNS